MRRTGVLDLLAHVAGVAERVAAGLRPNAEAVRAGSDVDACEEMPGACRQGVDLVVVSAAEPEHVAVRRDAAHVGAASAGEAPLRDLPSPREADDRDRALAAVGDVEELAVAARVEAVRALSRGDEAGDLQS